MNLPKHYRKLRIFVASPGDVEVERGRLVSVVEELNRGLADHSGLVLEVADWRTYIEPAMGRPEQVILDRIPVSEWDVFIGILWLRFGSPTGALNSSTGEAFTSGTHEEFAAAYDLWKETNRPRIMFYRCTRPPATMVGFDIIQFERIGSFFDQFSPSGTHPGLYQVFDTTESFERKIRAHLQAVILEYAEELREKPIAFEAPLKLDEVQAPEESRKRVFIVHGHDEAMKQAVARILEKLGIEPIVLHEKPNLGRTIIEKFTDFSDVSFAVVLLSPDDWVYAKGQSVKRAKSRARQNVILELGYFIGKLGRNRVFTLYRDSDDFEMPSDYSGVLYAPFDNLGQWQFVLIRELRACGFMVDANRIL